MSQKMSRRGSETRARIAFSGGRQAHWNRSDPSWRFPMPTARLSWEALGGRRPALLPTLSLCLAVTLGSSLLRVPVSSFKTPGPPKAEAPARPAARHARPLRPGPRLPPAPRTRAEARQEVNLKAAAPPLLRDQALDW